MKTRFCIFILTCLLAVGVVGCSTPEEVVTTNAPSPALKCCSVDWQY
jgi:hypothetical protein